MKLFVINVDIIMQALQHMAPLLPEIRSVLHGIRAAKKVSGLTTRLLEYCLGQLRTLTELAVRDPLTGLYNKRELIPRLKHEISRSDRYKRPLSVAMLDIDFFKKVNDTHGHPAGDKCLQIFTQIILGCIRTADIAVRYGGEEFFLVFPETSLEAAKIPLERLRQKVEAAIFDLYGVPVKITVSIGLASLSPASTITAEELIKKADDALYQAKAEGRNRLCFA